MRIAIAGLLHESNSFSSARTDLGSFRSGSLVSGDDIARRWQDSSHEIAGFLEGGQRFGFEIHPTLFAQAVPSGPVTGEAFDALTGELIERLRSAPALDGLLLALHGAMVTEAHPHADAEVVRRVRAALGPGFPLVVTHDFHANIPPEMMALSTALLTYKQNPHVDQRERGAKAAQIMAAIVRGEASSAQAIAKPPLLLNIYFQNTSRGPLLHIVRETQRLETEPGILAASLSGGYQYADVPQVGPSLIVVTHGDPERASREARRLADMLWATRERLELNLPGPAEAVGQAIASDRPPVVLVDMGDNIGGGSAGDSTFLLEELLRQNARGWVVVIADPAAVQLAAQSGVSAAFEADVGGKTDSLHGRPVRLRGRVKSLHDGRYMEPEVRHGGDRHLDQGAT
ncbi:MAG: M81 family metallopeptidase, partial [Acidobacteria bacterium]|nr:M81 family metallopeptidase [Acidobacteriota bacterium]